MRTAKKTITQREIAVRADIKPDFLNHILKGRRPSPKQVAVRLETVTGISRDTWIWGTAEDMRRAVEHLMFPQGGQHGP
jgi:plasmid maintenance system antidote protein VapI